VNKPPDPPVINPAEPAIILCVGKKRSGKSVAARALWDSWPYDALCIDPTGDARPPGATPLTLPLPSKFPDRGEDGEPVRLWFLPDPGSDTYLDDLDRALGLALYPKDKRVLVWLDEIGELADSSSASSVMQRRLLNQLRHYHASALACGPRPMKIDPLWISQADYVFVYELPNPRDRERIADNIGYPPAKFHEACEETRRRGAYWFLLWDAKRHLLFRMPPMPEVVQSP
jgi:hypothetical protein